MCLQRRYGSAPLPFSVWLRAQAAHDTEVASAELAEAIERIEPLAWLRCIKNQ